MKQLLGSLEDGICQAQGKGAESPEGWVMSKLEEQHGAADTSCITRPQEAETRDKASLYGRQTIFPL